MSLSGKRIFVVEDNLENRIVIDVLLKEKGATTYFDRWGKFTIQRLRDFVPVDMILLDLMLPKGLTGYAIFDSIRECPEFAGVPVVAVSAADASEAIPKAKAKGFAGFISKPLDFVKFAEQIETILAGKAIWKE